MKVFILGLFFLSGIVRANGDSENLKFEFVRSVPIMSCFTDLDYDSSDFYVEDLYGLARYELAYREKVTQRSYFSNRRGEIIDKTDVIIKNHVEEFSNNYSSQSFARLKAVVDRFVKQKTKFICEE